MMQGGTMEEQKKTLKASILEHLQARPGWYTAKQLAAQHGVSAPATLSALHRDKLVQRRESANNDGSLYVYAALPSCADEEIAARIRSLLETFYPQSIKSSDLVEWAIREWPDVASARVLPVARTLVGSVARIVAGGEGWEEYILAPPVEEVEEVEEAKEEEEAEAEAEAEEEEEELLQEREERASNAKPLVLTAGAYALLRLMCGLNNNTMAFASVQRLIGFRDSLAKTALRADWLELNRLDLLEGETKWARKASALGYAVVNGTMPCQMYRPGAETKTKHDTMVAARVDALLAREASRVIQEPPAPLPPAPELPAAPPPPAPREELPPPERFREILVQIATAPQGYSVEELEAEVSRPIDASTMRSFLRGLLFAGVLVRKEDARYQFAEGFSVTPSGQVIAQVKEVTVDARLDEALYLARKLQIACWAMRHGVGSMNERREEIETISEKLIQAIGGAA